jgi:methyltransferase (TIGR00027 family)
MGTTGAVFYRIVQLVLLPFGLVGYVLFVGKLVAHSRRTGVSATVLASLYTRYMQHQLGTRRDAPAARLMMVMPSVSHLGLYLATAPTLAAHRLTGHVSRIYRYPYEGIPHMGHQPTARTTFYDNAVDRYLREIDQFVVLGAGFDTRAYRLPADAPARCFEIDTPRTQALKREMLSRADVDASRITYVAADFQTEEWFDGLIDAGFDPTHRALFIWESVTMYLERRDVESSLRMIARAASGTVIAFDYVATELIESPSAIMRYTRAMLRATSEPWRFGIDNTPPVRHQVAGLVESCGLVLVDLHNVGLETDRQRAAAGFAVASVP